MKLISCHIENFGKLHDYSVDFSAGLHNICEKNGWGKTTFAAFLRAMFYGLEGERKRSIEENERKRYKPWQGGVFGGQIVFEIKGKVYVISRIFNDKEANDEFELRDWKTNLLSNDYSHKIGEEIFKINRESFLRTIFIGQNACETTATDDINAKIGNLVDNSNDLNNFDSAYATLTGILNGLTPKRVTGSLSRRKNEIAKYERIVQDGQSIQTALDACQEQLQSAIAKKEELERFGRERIDGEENSENRPLLCILGVMAAILGIILAVSVSWVPGIAAFGVGALLVIAGIIENRKQAAYQPEQDLYHQLTKDLEQVQKAIFLYNKRISELQEKYDDWEESRVKLGELKKAQEAEQKKYQYVLAAREKLSKAKETMTAKYAAPILEGFGKYYKMISGKEADDFHIDVNTTVTVDEMGKQREVNTLSSGYRDLIGICLRLALVDAMYRDESPMLIMDDPFANLDDWKIDACMQFLEKLAEKYQIIYFTCSNARSV
jgi:uncharacterized protein YhaN